MAAAFRQSTPPIERPLGEASFMPGYLRFRGEGRREQVKLEEQLLITKDGPELLSQAPFDWRFLT